MHDVKTISAAKGMENKNNNPQWDINRALPFTLSFLKGIQATSNQVFEKNNATDTIEGARYIIETRPSTLRPVRSWIIRVEEWQCTNSGIIQTKDILHISLKNLTRGGDNPSDYIEKMMMCGEIMIADPLTELNMLNALSTIISKIDAGRMPDIPKIMMLYNLK